jgi:hypothetical protein
MVITFARKATLTLVDWDGEKERPAQPQRLRFNPGDCLEVDADERYWSEDGWYVSPTETGGIVQLPRRGWTVAMGSDELR